MGQFERFKAASAFRLMIENWHISDFHVSEARPSQEDGYAEHLSTRGDNLPRSRLRQEGDYTIVLFKHEGWAEPNEFMHHCSTKWGSYLMSLKSLVETGEGAPSPRDVQISDWH